METFVVHVWTPADDSPATADARTLRGTVEDLTSGQTLAFRNDADLCRLIKDFMETDGHKQR